MENISKKYYIGLDIGTNSVGWAVLKEDFSLMRKNGKHMWGSRLFEDAESAASTRFLRQSRRRYERRKERIRLLQMLLEKTVSEVDPSFFARLEKSFLLNVKDDAEFGRDNIYNLFDGSYTDKNYYREFKTIYHLRKKLCESTEKADIRLVYLALHHIIKYRGNFLHDEDFSTNISGAETIINAFIARLNNEILVNEDGEIFNFFDGVSVADVCTVLSDTKKRKREKQKELRELWKDKPYSKKADIFLDALLGYKVDLAAFFDIEIPEDKDKKDYSFNFSDGDYEEKALNHAELFGADIAETIELMHAAYQDLMLRGLLGEGNSLISEGMIAIYDKHASDLKLLKDLLRSYPDLYKEMFKKVKKESYTGYIKNDKQSKKRVSDYTQLKQEDFYKAVKATLAKVSDSKEKEYILKEIENGTFLPKINSAKNAAIPYQLNLAELKLIIKNQSPYYPELKENAEKIESILTFRRPYSVGVIGRKGESRFSWIDEDTVADVRVYPWNYYDEGVVDIDRASANFIKRMTSRCRYFPDEFVLPLNSPIYQKYIVLNELNKIKIIDKQKGERPLSIAEKQAVFNEVFLLYKSVGVETVRKFLGSRFGVMSDKGAITGLSEENKFLGKMSAYIKLKEILTPEELSDGELVEKIVEDITVFSDKKIRRGALGKLGLSDETVKKLCGLNFAGWGRFSKKLLTGIKNQNGQTILDLLYETNKHFNEIIFDETLGFKEQIFTGQTQEVEANYSAVKELYLSPAVKRAVWQSMKLVKEVVKIMGHDPAGVYIESTRKDDKKTKAKSRLDKLNDLFKTVEKDVVFYNENVSRLVKNTENDRLNDDMIYLYLLQMGKSMYSGKPLGDIETLSTRCEIDHIIPQCFIKDDSIENRVLVLKEENQQKSGALVLPKAVRDNMSPFWGYLYKNGLIGKKKYFALLRTDFSEADRQHFINRQLVETNQSVKAVRDLFKQVFPESDVELIKAGISSEFRRAHVKEGYLSFIKLRDLNDMHHAKDAYLACAIARFTRKLYPIWGADSEARLLKNEIEALTSGEDVSALVNRRNGIVVDAMRYGNIDSVRLASGETVDWNTCYNNILKSFDFNDCLVTKQTEITANSAFYNATVYGNNDKKGKGDIPLRQGTTNNGEKKDLPLRYGRYSSENCAYFLNVTYQKGKKQETKLMGVPVIVTYKAEKDENAVKEYFEKLLSDDGKTLVGIDKQKIRLFQPITFGGHYCYITSDSYLISAVQLSVDKRFYPLLYAIAHPFKKFVFDKNIGEKQFIADRDYFEPLMKEFVLYHVEKVKKLYPLYEKLAVGAEEYVRSGGFEELDYYDPEKHIDKAEYISRLLNLTRAGSTQLDMKNFGGKTGWGMLSGKSIIKDKVAWHYQSVTGIYEQIVLPKE